MTLKSCRSQAEFPPNSYYLVGNLKSQALKKFELLDLIDYNTYNYTVMLFEIKIANLLRVGTWRSLFAIVTKVVAQTTHD